VIDAFSWLVRRKAKPELETRFAILSPNRKTDDVRFFLLSLRESNDLYAKRTLRKRNGRRRVVILRE